MREKKVSLLINPRTGENVAKLPAILAVLAAAGWKIKIDLKEYGKHVMKLARKAAHEGDDLVLAYGGDGTLNQVVNGVMSAGHKASTVGIMPGGTANVWAGEIGVPTDPVKAALALINSDIRKVDVGQITLHSVVFPQEPISDHEKKYKNDGKKRLVRHHFLLMAGLGFDAAVMEGVSKPLKYRIGPWAVGLSIAKNLSIQHPFPLEIRDADAAKDESPLWSGEALQVVVGNTRRYAKIASITPDAHIDDGILDVCIIINGDPISMMGQISSLLLRLKPDKTTAEYLRGRRFLMTVPATVPFQVDGSAVQLKGYLNAADYARLRKEGEPEKVKVTYRIEALPHALQVAIPRTYNDELFEHAQLDAREDSAEEVSSETQGEDQEDHHGFSLFSHKSEAAETSAQQHTNAEISQAEVTTTEIEPQEQPSKTEKQAMAADIENLIRHGWKVKIVGKVVDPAHYETVIVAGTTPKQATGEIVPVALVINEHTELFDRKGQRLANAVSVAQSLSANTLIIVDGAKNKRNVIQARRAIL